MRIIEIPSAVPVPPFQMKFNNSTNNNSSNNGNKNTTTTTNTSSSNSSSSDYLGMNEIDTDTHVVWPSWCYAGKSYCKFCFPYAFVRHGSCVFFFVYTHWKTSYTLTHRVNEMLEKKGANLFNTISHYNGHCPRKCENNTQNTRMKVSFLSFSHSLCSSLSCIQRNNNKK